MHVLLALFACHPDSSKQADCTEVFFADADADAHGDATVSITSCAAPHGYTAADDDCDDTNPEIHPDAIERCNGIDDDCNAAIDDGIEANDWYADSDGDGFGDAFVATACEQPADTVLIAGDCDDAEVAVHPDAAEVCNDVDDDCDDLVDDGDPSVTGGSLWYVDLDLDHYGDPESGVSACLQPPDRIANGMDCDDTDGAIHPDAEEICDTVDNDCDALVDDDDAAVSGGTTFYYDGDGDGYGQLLPTTVACVMPVGFADNTDDCDDADASNGPPLTYYSDADDDGYGSGAGVTTCTPTGRVVVLDGDCDRNDAAINPGATEVCNGIDDNCDDLVDLDDPLVDATIYGDADGDGYGSDADAVTTCDAMDGYVDAGGDCDDSDVTVNPGELEYCDAIDNDCNGAVDDDVAYVDWYADDDGDGFGDASDTVSDCAPPSGYVLDTEDCDDAVDTTHPGATEVCVNAADDDCDGAVDNCAFPLEDADVIVQGTEDVYANGIGAMLTAGDLDADGTADLVIGHNNADDYKGAVYILLGPASSTSELGDALTLSTATRRAYLGGGLSAGDANGDGAVDLAVAAVDRDSASGEDVVYLFLGPVTADHDADDADATFEGEDESATGAELDIVSDFDGDAVADIVIGAYEAGDFYAGQVYVVSGASSGTMTLPTDATYVYESATWEGFGYDGAAFGDANGDGIGDLALIAISGGSSSDGTAYVVPGGGAGGVYDVNSVAAATISNANDGHLDAVTAADYDGDGSVDLFLADTDADSASGEIWAGAVYAFLGPLTGALSTTDADATWVSDVIYGALGTSIEVGDVDGDKNVDVLMGAPVGGPDHHGDAYLQFGVASGTIDVGALLSFPTDTDQARVGDCVTMIPDWTGDDGAEVAIGAPYSSDAAGDRVGSVYIFFSDALFYERAGEAVSIARCRR